MYKTIAILGIILFFTAAGIFPASQAEKYADLLGTWDVETDGGQYTFTFEFFLEEGNLAGKFTGSSGETKMENLSYVDKQLKFRVDVNGMIIDFEATIEGDSLSGMLSLEYGEAEITGEKRK